MATLSGFFGLLAGALAVIGLDGVISYMVARRRGEIGIRMALGANCSAILALAAAAARAASSLLYGLQPNDPATLGLATVTLAVVALVASLLPALRAARIEPMVALREE